MAWNRPLADHTRRAGTKLPDETTNNTFMTPLPTRPRPTNRRAPIRSARRPMGTAERE